MSGFPKLGLPLGVAGSPAPSRYVGGGPGVGPPVAGGPYRVGDFIVDTTAAVYVCSVAGSPGTWVTGGTGGSQQIQALAPAGSVASFDFAAIPQTFRAVRGEAVLRTDNAATFETVLVLLNGDAVDANYDHERLTAFSATAQATQVLGAAGSRFVGEAPGAGAAAGAGAFSSLEFEIVGYADTDKFKLVRWRETMVHARSNNNVIVRTGLVHWASLAAVNRITLVPNAGPNFVVGSKAFLTGLS